MNTHLQVEPDQNSLIDMAMVPPKKNAKSILVRMLYLLLHPHKWTWWIKTLFLDFKYSRAYLGKRIYNGNYALGRTGSTSSGYKDLMLMFNHINIVENDVIVDVGCGKGRVLNFLLSRYPKSQLIGLEIDPMVADDTRKRLSRYSQVSIMTGDVEDRAFFPNAGTVFYLFNPFFEDNVRKFSNFLTERIQRGCYRDHNRPLIIYYHCYHLHVFEENPIWEVKKLNDVFAAIIFRQ